MGKNQDPGSGINIPDPQHCFFVLLRCSLFEKILLSSRMTVRAVKTIEKDEEILVSYFNGKVLLLIIFTMKCGGGGRGHDEVEA
jgi:hypothetical protein